SSTTRPFPSRAQQEVQSGRIAGFITALIILATLLLLGFSVYLAAYLGFISLPFINIPTTATSVPQIGVVPNLVGDTWEEAQRAAARANFKLQSINGSQTGVVVSQDPQAGTSLSLHSTIDVQMGSNTITVPSGLVGQSLSAVEQLLSSAGLKYTIQDAGADPTKPANTVERVEPPSGTK